MNKKIYIFELILFSIFFFVLKNTPYFSVFESFYTILHEICHGITTYLTGGSIKYISFDSFKSAHIVSSGGIYFLIGISGYIGTSIIAALFFYIKNKRVFFIILNFIILFSLFFFTKISYQFFISFLFSLFLIFLSFKSEKIIDHIVFMFGVYIGLNNLNDIYTYLFAIPYKTDSGLIAQNLGLPFLTLPISLFMSISSLFILYLGFKYWLLSNNKDSFS